MKTFNINFNIKIHDGTPWHNQMLQGIRLFSTLMLILLSGLGIVAINIAFKLIITDNFLIDFAFLVLMCFNWMPIFLGKNK